jgi:hypothetical protein
MTFPTAVWGILLELAPSLLLGTVVAGLLHVVLPQRLVRDQLTGPWGVVKASLLGVPMPLCSCGVIPAGLGLRKDGASEGATIAFFISTPQIAVDSILVSASFLGWPFALFKVGAAMTTGVLGGWLTDALGRGRGTEPAPEELETDAPGKTWRAMLEHGLSILRRIWGWVVAGVLVSAAIELWVPDAWLAGLGRLGSFGAIGAALLVSLPLYVCATASVPIAAALVAGGMPAGAALVFLMAGPATNLAEIGAVYRGFGLRTSAIYLLTLVVGSVGAALLFDGLLLGTRVATAPADDAAPWWAVASAVLLIGLLAVFALGSLRRRLGARSAASAREAGYTPV